jgi:hypothetical protein
MKLWTQWLWAVRALRPACHRSLTFVWMALVLMGMCCRSEVGQRLVCVVDAIKAPKKGKRMSTVKYLY